MRSMLARPTQPSPRSPRSPRDMLQPPPLPLPARGRPRPRSALLLSPFYPKDPRTSFGKHVLTPSLTFSSLAGATPPGWELAFWDENLLQGPPPTEYVPEVVGITVHLTFADRAYALARWFRARGSLVVMGGLHVQACPEEVAASADAIALGNGAQTWPQILRDVEAGALQPRYEGAYNGYRDEPLPDRSVLPPSGFLTPLSLVATRGCHNRCDFCFLATGDLRMKYETLAIEQVTRQFEQSGAPYGVFVDNNLGSNRRFLRRLCAALRPLERIWSAAVSIDVTDDEGLVLEMARAGCTGVFIGFESLTDENLRAAGKRSPRVEDYGRRVALLQRHGIQVNGSFVLGFDNDGPEVFEQTAAWVEANRLECATYHILTPYPGTPLFARLEAEGRLLHRDWSRYDTAHAVFQPHLMSPDELERGYAWLYARTFSLASILARRPREAAAVPAYLAMALLYKRSNWLWPWLIRKRLVHTAWAPLVEASRRRHCRYRRSLETPEPRGGHALPYQATL